MRASIYSYNYMESWDLDHAVSTEWHHLKRGGGRTQGHFDCLIGIGYDTYGEKQSPLSLLQ